MLARVLPRVPRSLFSERGLRSGTVRCPGSSSFSCLKPLLVGSPALTLARLRAPPQAWLAFRVLAHALTCASVYVCVYHTLKALSLLVS